MSKAEVVKAEAVEDEINYLDEKEKKAEMLMEADKQNGTEAEKDETLEKDGLKPDHYFSGTLFKDLNLSE